MRQRRSFVRPEGKKSARLVVIASEGSDTEPIYFGAVKTELCYSNVHVEVLKRSAGSSNPESVYQQLRQFKEEYNHYCPRKSVNILAKLHILNSLTIV